MNKKYNCSYTCISHQNLFYSQQLSGEQDKNLAPHIEIISRFGLCKLQENI